MLRRIVASGPSRNDNGASTAAGNRADAHRIASFPVRVPTQGVEQRDNA